MSKAGQARLEAVAVTLAVVRRIYPQADDTVALLVEALRATTYDNDVRAGLGDPTPTTAHQIGPWLYWQRDVDHNLALALHHVNELHRLMSKVPSDLDTARLAAMHRCQPPSGKEALEPWVRPDCTNIIGQYSTIMLCDACRQRRDYWRAKQQVNV